MEDERIQVYLRTMKNQQANTIDDDYDNGFYNGLELAIALLENREAIFRNEWKKTQI